MFSQITVGFVVNNLLAYLSLATFYLVSLATSSLLCSLLGYTILYTFMSYMFWINAMAANIFFKFSSMMSSSSDNDTVNLVLYILYAQVNLFRYKAFSSHLFIRECLC